MSYFQDKVKINLISNTNWYKLTACERFINWWSSSDLV